MVSIGDQDINLSNINFNKLTIADIKNEAMYQGIQLKNVKLKKDYVEAISSYYRKNSKSVKKVTLKVAYLLGINVSPSIDIYSAYDLDMMSHQELMYLAAIVGSNICMVGPYVFDLLNNLKKIGKLHKEDSIVIDNYIKSGLKLNEIDIIRSTDNNNIWSPTYGESGLFRSYISTYMYSVPYNIRYNVNFSIMDCMSSDDLKKYLEDNDSTLNHDELMLAAAERMVSENKLNPVEFEIMRLPKFRLFYKIQGYAGSLEYETIRYNLEFAPKITGNMTLPRVYSNENYYTKLNKYDVCKILYDRDLYFPVEVSELYNEIYEYDKIHPEFINSIKNNEYDKNNKSYYKLYLLVYNININTNAAVEQEIYNEVINVFGHCKQIEGTKEPRVNAYPYEGGMITNPEDAYNLSNNGVLINRENIAYDEDELSYEELINLLRHQSLMDYSRYKYLKNIEPYTLQQIGLVIYISYLTSELMTNEELIFTLSRCYYPEFDYDKRLIIKYALNNINDEILNTIKLKNRKECLNSSFKILQAAGNEMMDDIYNIHIIDKNDYISTQDKYNFYKKLANKYEFYLPDEDNYKYLIKSIYSYAPRVIMHKFGMLENLQDIKSYISRKVLMLPPTPRKNPSESWLNDIYIKLQRYSNKDIISLGLSKNYDRHKAIKCISLLIYGANFYINIEDNLVFGNLPDIHPSILTIPYSDNNNDDLEEYMTINAITYEKPSEIYKTAYDNLPYTTTKLESVNALINSFNV